MTTLSHDPTELARQQRAWSVENIVHELWAGISIVAIWLAVLFTAIFGPDIDNTSAGGDTSRVPSVVPVALFAFLATWALAKYAYRRRD